MKLTHFFLPHPETHKKAHLLSIEALVIYLLIFIFLFLCFATFARLQPGILGVSSNITKQQIIDLTNAERAKFGLSPVSENSALSQAAEAKARNMFEENYWAHFAPSGKDPWGFMSAAGYSFSFAGENLAKNFSNSDEVMNAWMNSPSHKENIINSRYQEIGIAVLDGTLQDQNTTLVVQMFGTPFEAIAEKPVINISGEQVALSSEEIASSKEKIEEANPLKIPQQIPISIAGQQETRQPLVNSFSVMRSIGLSLFAFLGGLLLIDLYLIRRRAIHRFSSRHLPHLIMLGLATSALLNMTPGSIL